MSPECVHPGLKTTKPTSQAMLERLFCFVDDFCQEFMPIWEAQQILSGKRKRIRKQTLSDSEVMTLMILFHQSHYRHFKHFYLNHVCKHLKDAFPDRVSYNRFVERKKTVLVPLCFLLQVLRGEATGIYFIDSTTLKVCHIKREKQNKVFGELAEKSKSTLGWYYGFKLHLVINDKGEIMACKITRATTNDLAPVEDLTQGLIGKLVGDKGYISQALSERLLSGGLQLITRIRKNMKKGLMRLLDMRKRALIETVNDQLKNISQIEHTRHRSVYNFMGNLLCGLIAYCFQPKKPRLRTGNNKTLICL